jgi:hypothetical protein
MIILQETTSPQTISFIPRSNEIDTIVIRNETTNVETTYRTADKVYQFKDRVLADGGTFEAKDCLINLMNYTDTYLYVGTFYSNYDLVLDLKEGNFYNITFLNGDVVQYKDRIFCTNQQVTYSINKDKYISNSSNNDFIVYE